MPIPDALPHKNVPLESFPDSLKVCGVDHHHRTYEWSHVALLNMLFEDGPYVISSRAQRKGSIANRTCPGHEAGLMQFHKVLGVSRSNFNTALQL
jgi:hypothetical protein